MKNGFFVLTIAAILTGCSGGGGGGGGGSSVIPQIISSPNAKCGGSNCINTGASLMSLAQKGQVGILSTGGYPFFQLEYQYLLDMVSSVKTGIDKVNSLASSAGFSTCADIPTSGTKTDGSVTATFSTPESTIDFGYGDGPIVLDKKILLSVGGSNIAQIGVNCGASTVQTVHAIYKPSVSEQYEVAYQIDTATGFILLQTASVIPRSNITAKTMAQFHSTSSTAFELTSISQYTDSSVGTNNVQFQSVSAKTDGTDASNLEYVVAYPNPSTNGTGDTTSVDTISYGTGQGYERICMVGYKGASPTFSTTSTDCHTASQIADAPNGGYVPSTNGGTLWTTSYAHGLTIADPQ